MQMKSKHNSETEKTLKGFGDQNWDEFEICAKLNHNLQLGNNITIDNLLLPLSQSFLPKLHWEFPFTKQCSSNIDCSLGVFHMEYINML